VRLGLLCWVGTLLGACGGGQSTPTAAKPRAAAASERVAVSPPAPRAVASSSGPLSPAQAVAFARAVNLKPGDVPGASIAPKEARSHSRENREERACGGVTRQPHRLAEASSPKLKRGQELESEEIVSSVTVFDSEREMAHQISTLSTRSLRECLARVLTRNLSAKNFGRARFGRVTVSKLPVQVAEASATVGIRVQLTVEVPAREVSVPVYVDLLGFGERRAGVAIAAVSATQPVPGATEHELLMLLQSRAQSQPL
jgi:hypothetical protein